MCNGKKNQRTSCSSAAASAAPPSATTATRPLPFPFARLCRSFVLAIQKNFEKHSAAARIGAFRLATAQRARSVSARVGAEAL